MKVTSIELKNFKQTKHEKLDFKEEDTGLAKDLILLVGDSGGGKTSVLQVIAATLGHLTDRLQNIKDLKWKGYNYNLLKRKLGLEVILEIEDKRDPRYPSGTIKKLQWETETDSIKISSTEQVPTCTEQVPTCTEQVPGRNLWFSRGSLSLGTTCEDSANSTGFSRDVMHPSSPLSIESFVLWYTEERINNHFYFNKIDLNNENNLRNYLLGLKEDYKRQSKDNLVGSEKHFLKRIENIYKGVYPERQFLLDAFDGQVALKDHDSEFYIYNGNDIYELSEMSAGERSIIPFMIDFGTSFINNSVILIDEIELHLYPSRQQNLLRTLTKLGHNNQFFISTNSDFIHNLIPSEHINKT